MDSWEPIEYLSKRVLERTNMGFGLVSGVSGEECKEVGFTLNWTLSITGAIP
jgi:hypothetical protein